MLSIIMKNKKEKVIIFISSALGDFIWFTSVIPLIKSFNKNFEITLITYDSYKSLIDKNLDINLIFAKKNCFFHRYKFIRYIYKFIFMIDFFKIFKLYKSEYLIFLSPPMKFSLSIFHKIYKIHNIFVVKELIAGLKIRDKDIKDYVKIIDLGNINNLHIMMRYQKAIRSIFLNYNLSIPILPDTSFLSSKIKLLITNTKNYKIAFCTRGSADWKFLNIDFLKEVISQIDDIYDTTFFVIGSGNSKFDDTDKLKKLLPNKDIRSVYNKTSLLELTEFMKNMDLLISIDTGVVHIAAAVNTPVISLCGPTLPIHSAPVYHKGVSLYSRRSCSPCDIQSNTNNKICKDMKCLKDISSDMLVEEVRKILK